MDSAVVVVLIVLWLEFAIEEEVHDSHEGADVITYDVQIAKAS